VPAIYLATGSDPLAGLIDALRFYEDAVVDRGLHRIRAEIPEYRRIEDPGFVDDVREHIDLHHDALIRSLAAGRPLDRDELGFIRPRATRRVGRIPLPAFMQAFRIYTEELWDTIVGGAGDEASRAIALQSAGTVIRYMNVAAAEAAEVYVEAERLLHAHGERVRRDLLEDLLAGRPPAIGPKLTAAREAGLYPPAPCVLIAAVPPSSPQEEGPLRSAAAALSRAVGCAASPLTVVRHDEVLVIAPLQRELPELLDRLQTLQSQLADEGVPLAIGVSTVQDDLRRMDDAYGEAVTALERVRSAGGVVALPALSAFECLTLFGHETARRRIPPAVKRFVADDLAEGRVLTSTLLEYVAADLNTKVAAERLFVHPNTARYRLGKIEERTSCDLRRVADVLDLLIAIQIEQNRPIL
jgi:hypothetical protein